MVDSIIEISRACSLGYGRMAGTEAVVRAKMGSDFDVLVTAKMYAQCCVNAVHFCLELRTKLASFRNTLS